MYVENGTYFRLRNAQLGYTLPASLTQRIKLQKVRFYVSGQNLFTISSYSGMDPEVGQSSSLSRGIDYGIYPQNISFTGGLMLLFKIYNVMFKNKYIIGIVLAILTGFSSCADLDLAPLGSPEAGEISEERQAFCV